MPSKAVDKPWWMSRAILGGAAAIIAGIFGLSSADAAQLAELGADLASVAGGALAVYGRIKATGKIRGVRGRADNHQEGRN